MKTSQLDLRELLSFRKPQGSSFSFLGQRSYLVDAASEGLKRKELLTTVGSEITRTIVTRSGYAHGWRVAETIKRQLPEAWSEAKEGKLGPIISEMYGFGEIISSTRTDGLEQKPLVETKYTGTLEAEQHLMLIGPSDETVCWRLAAFASGYVSHVQGRPVYFIETECLAKGDELCRFIGKYLDQWGDEIIPHLPYYEGTSIENLCNDLHEKIVAAENQLRHLQRDIAHNLKNCENSSCYPIAKSQGMQRVMDLALHVAKSPASILVTGESGVGKEKLASMIHKNSHRETEPFLAINCGALTETLLDSELFGYKKGAFTGADNDRVGLFEAADGGTLFLDEVGELSTAMQVKLLRVLQEKEIRRVGENKAHPVDVRIISATNRKLEEAVSTGDFRQDLYYRLKVIELNIPPLRERSDDILPLSRCFLESFASSLDKNISGFGYKAADLLLMYKWPGNVRELQNAIEHAAVLCRTTQIEPEDLPIEVRHASYNPSTVNGIKPIETIEKEYILSALKALQYNKAKTAKELGISPATLYRKLKQYEFFL